MPASVGLDVSQGMAAAAFVQGVRQPKLVESPPAGEWPRAPVPALVFDASIRVGARPSDRIEARGETPVIGSGIDWPPSAGFDGGDACPRIPLALAIADVCRGLPHGSRVGWPVERNRDGTALRIMPEEAIGRFAAHVSDSRPWLPDSVPPKYVLAVPNAMPLRAMTGLIRASSGKIRLIWRPVASLIEALRVDESAFASVGEADHVLVLHVGIDGYEATLLHVIERERDRGPKLTVPGRPRFVDGLTNVAAPLGGILRRIADRRAFGTSVALGEAWARCWLHPHTRGDPQPSWPIGPWAAGDGSRDESGWGWFCRAVRSDVSASHRTEAMSFRERAVRMVRASKRVKAVVVTGDLVESMRDLVDAIVRDIGIRDAAVLGDAAVGRGAAIFGWREQAGWPTYLDYLPQLQLFAERNGEPEWNEVVRSDWIDAGEPFTETRSGFSLRRGSPGEVLRRVELAVSLEGEPHVKETQDRVEVPLHLAEREVKLSIQVEVQAASGEPRVTASTVDVPTPAQVTLDWAIAESTGKTPAEYLESRPRAFPPIESVRPAAWWYRETNYRTIALSDQDRRAFPPCASSVAPSTYIRNSLETRLTLLRLRRIRSLVIRRQWDRDGKFWTGAVGGDGSVLAHDDVLRDLHSSLLEVVKESNSKSRRDDAPSVADAVKVLAWTGFQDPRFEKYLVVMLEHGSGSDLKLGLYGCGNAVRSSQACAQVIRCLTRLLDAEITRAERERKKLSRVNEPLRQLAWMLALREVATSGLDADDARAALVAVYQCANLLHRENNRKVMFQWAVRCLVLLLGRRRFDDDFVAPDSADARALIRFCGEVYFVVADADEVGRRLAERLGTRAHRVASAPNPKVAQHIRTFLEYIDRRGSGSIIVDEDDDDEDASDDD